MLTNILLVVLVFLSCGGFYAVGKVAADLRSHKDRAVVVADLKSLLRDIVEALPTDKALKVRDYLRRLSPAEIADLAQNDTPRPAPLPPPPPPAAALKVLLPLALLLGLTSRVRADGLFVGPTVPATKYDLSFRELGVLPAGAGLAVGYGLFPRVIRGVSWDMLDVEVAAFGTDVAGVKTASIAALVGTLSNLVSVGGGRDVYSSVGRSGWFLLADFGVKLGILSGLSEGSASKPSIGGAVEASPPPEANRVELPL